MECLCFHHLVEEGPPNERPLHEETQSPFRGGERTSTSPLARMGTDPVEYDETKRLSEAVG